MQLVLLLRCFTAWFLLRLLSEIWWPSHWAAFKGNVTPTNICTFVLVQMELCSLYWS